MSHTFSPHVFSRMRQALTGILLLMSIQGAWSQEPTPPPREPGRWIGQRPTSPPPSRMPGPRHNAVAAAGTPSAPSPPGVITDTGFASRLGTAVSTQGYPTVPLPAGVSGINHPGLAPSPSMQPLPTGSPFPVPNINYPGSFPAGNMPPRDANRDNRSGRDVRQRPNVIYYGIPYYVPYYVYPQGISQEDTSQSSSQAAPAGRELSSSSAAKPLTLLAFKDGTVLVVREYWLEADWLYYEITEGQRLSVPLDRLDQSLTQQLNRERNVPFILEVRR